MKIASVCRWASAAGVLCTPDLWLVQVATKSVVHAHTAATASSLAHWLDSRLHRDHALLILQPCFRFLSAVRRAASPPARRMSAHPSDDVCLLLLLVAPTDSPFARASFLLNRSTFLYQYSLWQLSAFPPKNVNPWKTRFNTFIFESLSYRNSKICFLYW